MLSRLLSLRSFISRSAHSKCGDFLNGLSVVPLDDKTTEQWITSASVSPAEHPWRNLFRKRDDPPAETSSPPRTIEAPAYYANNGSIKIPTWTNTPTRHGRRRSSVSRAIYPNETIRLCDVVAFRTATSKKLPRTDVNMNEATEPFVDVSRLSTSSSSSSIRPVIYRYVDVIKNSVALLEAIHFELFMPDRADLRFLGVPLSSIPSGTIEGDYFRVPDADLLSDPSFAVELDKYTYPVVWEAKKIQKMIFDDMPKNGKIGLAYVERSEKELDAEMVVSDMPYRPVSIRSSLFPDEESRREHSLVSVTTVGTNSAHLHPVEVAGKEEAPFDPCSEYLKRVHDVRTSSQRPGRAVTAVRALTATEAERIKDRLGGFTTYGNPGDLELMDELFRVGCLHRLSTFLRVSAKYVVEKNSETTILKTIMDMNNGLIEECRPLLDCIYGRNGTVWNPNGYVDSSLTLQSAGMQLNEAQSRAVRMYADADGPRVFCILSPPGAGKTTVAAAMAAEVARIKNEDVQLLLSARNVSVKNIASALEKMDHGGRQAYYMNHTLDPMYPKRFDFFDLMGEDELNKWRTGTQSMTGKIVRKSGWVDTVRYKSVDECLRVNKEEFERTLNPNIILASADMALVKLLRFRNSMYNDLKTVKRIIIDDASVLSEAALYAIIRRFPQARIVLIGDVHQFPPFMYDEKILGHELAGRPALTVAMKTGRVPVVELNEVYRAPPSLVAPYNRLAYGGKLVSKKAEGDSPLSAIGLVPPGMPQLLLVDVDGKEEPNEYQNSLYNENEIEAVKRLLSKFPEEWKDEVMIICLQMEQKKRLQTDIDKNFSVRTLGRSRGKERPIVILMTTRTEIPEAGTPFYNIERCTLAVSRHQKALIILGKASLLTTHKPWSTVVNGDDFTRIKAEDI